MAPRQITLLDLRDRVPMHGEAEGLVTDGHAARQFLHIPVEGLGVVSPEVGESNLHLPHCATSGAFDLRDWQNDKGSPAVNGQRAKPTLHAGSGGYLAIATGRTAVVIGAWDMVKII